MEPKRIMENGSHGEIPEDANERMISLPYICFHLSYIFIFTFTFAFTYTVSFNSFDYSLSFQIARGLYRSLLENLIPVQDALIKKFVLRPLKALTQVLLSLSLPPSPSLCVCARLFDCILWMLV